MASVNGKEVLMICPVSGTNTGTMVYDCVKYIAKFDKVITSDVVEFSYGKHVSENFYVLPWASSKEFIPALVNVIKKEKVTVLVPGSDWELKVIADNIDIFNKLGVVVLMNSPKVMDICFDKERTVSFLEQNSFLFPVTIEVEVDKNTCVTELYEEIASQVGDVFIIKPKDNSGGSAGIYVIQDQLDLKNCVNYYKDSKVNIIAQQYIDAIDEEYTIGVMSDLKGAVISSFAMKRDLSTSRTCAISENWKLKSKSKDRISISGGYTQGLVDDFDDARKFAERVAKKIGSVGPLNIQCRRKKEGFYIFEINPRFSGTTSIRAEMGHNDLELIYFSHVEGINLGQQDFRKGSVVRGQSIVVRES